MSDIPVILEDLLAGCNCFVGSVYSPESLTLCKLIGFVDLPPRSISKSFGYIQPLNSAILALPKLIILDRDGVINHDSDHFIKTPDEWQPIEGSIEAIARLNKAGVLVAVATNQGGVGRDILSIDNLRLIHEKMHAALYEHGAHIDKLVYCDSPDRAHPDYKPNPGMLIKLCEHFGLNPKELMIPFVGDKESDLMAAKRAYCQPVLVKTGKGFQTAALYQIKHQTKDQIKHQNDDLVDFSELVIYENLSDYVNHILCVV
jgi:D-glycero-D-manno-heptose 1,7-bisphosphate phosphatase